MAGYLLHDQLSSVKNFPVLNEAYQILTTHGLNEIPTPPALEYGMIRGMLQSYDDPFTVFVEPAQFTLRRAEIQLPSVTWRNAADTPQVDILEVNLIASNTIQELEQGIQELQKSSASKFILDLRNNPGGLLESAIDISRLFLKDGVILQQQYRGKGVETFQVDHPGQFSDIPLIILINQSSASAAEIIAGALQAHHRAILIGTPSFGKNTIQLIFDLPGGAAIHVTSAKWWIPGSDLPQNGQGLQPDIFVSTESTNGTDPVLKSAVQMFADK